MPFRFDPMIEGMAATEQDTLDEVANCCEVIIRYHPGQRLLAPQFGVPDVVFEQIPVELDLLALPISRWEPRAVAALEQSTDPSDPLIERIEIAVSLTGRATT